MKYNNNNKTVNKNVNKYENTRSNKANTKTKFIPLPEKIGGPPPFKIDIRKMFFNFKFKFKNNNIDNETTPAYRRGDNPEVKTTIILSAPGHAEEEAGRPAAKQTGRR